MPPKCFFVPRPCLLLGFCALPVNVLEHPARMI
jgi:hypothetical protein